MERIIQEKVVLGVSACNVGAPFRYNRKGWDRVKNMGRERGDFEWHPVCPEVSAGLGIPREPIKIAGGNGDDVWEGKAKIINRKGEDVTEKLKKSCLATLEILRSANAIGYVYMEGSPTCGVYRTTLKNKRLGHPPGVLGSLLLKEGFFLIPAVDLDSPLRWWDWRRRLHAFAWVHSQDIQSKQDLYNLWYTVKFLCQEIDDSAARLVGKNLAILPKGFSSEYVENLKKEILEILRKPSTVNRIKERLWKSYVYFKKSTNQEIEDVLSPEIQRNMTRITKELIAMERHAFSHGTFFSSAPILYRSEQRVNRMTEE
ncbi:Uncharacterized conserved protein YbbK, DUF523 family [Tindallia magadiensis]|uniref:Uncharacterized conserved protein YbbK, DUF523 family n=2 Tax=Tindallia magadiensis TaxID=69895 RepID=A0A1I3ATL5_9FIRM|nr:Uncharacterized conserved protein YbbK, DUF523 family [Tindallia magadiensis]